MFWNWRSFSGRLLGHIPAPAALPADTDNTRALGILLYTKYLYPFEIAAVILLVVITARNPVYATLYLVLAFFNAAALFILLGAEFLGLILILVYVSAAGAGI